MESKARIIIITGDIQIGKTTLCREVMRQAKLQEIETAGLLSPAVFEEGKKVGIEALNVRSGKKRRLAVLRGEKSGGVETRRWSFIQEGLDWGNQVLRESVPCSLLIVDELGPIELQEEQGWVDGLKAIDSRKFQACLVVIRPHLVETARARWPEARIWEAGPPNSAPQKARDLLAEIGY
jgi:nucleoside-triphosphatase THEP1